MILSHQHRFIFLHCRKVAGSTITTLCNRYLGPKDIQVGVWGDTIAAGGAYNEWVLDIVGRKKEASGIVESVDTSRISPRQIDQLTRKFARQHLNLPGGAHPKAKAIREYDRDAWKKYFKFCFVRNPWAHAVSDYYWRRHIRKCEHVSFKEFLLRLANLDRPDPERITPPHRSNWDIYAIDGKVEADFVGRFENLKSDLLSVGHQVGLDLDLETIRSAKSGIRPVTQSIASHYDPESIDLVAQVYSREISEFGYSPDF